MQDKQNDSPLDNLYDLVTGDEDARVCKDIPDEACRHQPKNFFAYLIANCLNKVADEISSAKLILPWLFGVLQVPTLWTGLLVPIREGGVLVPQLAVASVARRLQKRKYVWVVGAVLSALALFGMAWAALNASGTRAGLTILGMLLLFSLARGLCSVSAKDVLGKTVSKSRRGALMGWSASVSGVVVLVAGLLLGIWNLQDGSRELFAGLLALGGVLWLLALVFFLVIEEHPGATEGGGNGLKVAIKQLGIVKTDAGFRRFVIARTLLLSVALAPPFYVLLAQSVSDAQVLGLGVLIIANGLASSLSSPVWGYMGDRSSRQVMMIAAVGAALLSLLTFAGDMWQWPWMLNEWGMAVLFLLLNVLHGGVRLGRKLYLVDMATEETRASYVAVSNTLIGLLMLLGGVIGWLGNWLQPSVIILVLGVIALLSALYVSRLEEVSG